MTPEERFAWIRLRASRFPSTLRISKSTRGCMVGDIGRTARSAADMAHLPVSNARDVFLELAAAIFGRPIRSYNELQASELWALHQWTRLDGAIIELSDWLRANYGEQLPLLREAGWTLQQ